jgi:hypothetical protein
MEVYNSVHLFVDLHIFDNAQYWKKKVWNCFVTALRNLSVVGGSVRSVVVIMGAVNTGDKKAHIKNYFRETFIKLSLLKQK